MSRCTLKTLGLALAFAWLLVPGAALPSLALDASASQSPLVEQDWLRQLEP
jgi:hypothetical protein